MLTVSIQANQVVSLNRKQDPRSLGSGLQSSGGFQDRMILGRFFFSPIIMPVCVYGVCVCLSLYDKFQDGGRTQPPNP